MNKELYLQTIKKGCSFLESEGYSYNQVDSNIFYTKNADEDGFRIRFSWLEYGEQFVTHGLTAEKRFNVVEQEIKQVLGGQIENYFTIHKSPAVDNNYNIKNLEYQVQGVNFRFVSNTIMDIELFCAFVEAFYKYDVVSFFSNYKLLIDVAKAYESMQREKISTFLINTGTDIFYRELVIKNKSKSSDEDRFVKMIINELEPMKANATFGKILENFKLLHSNLHKTE